MYIIWGCLIKKICFYSSTYLLINLLISVSEEAMAPHSSTLAWKIPWMEEPGRLQSMGRQESDTTERLPFHFSLSCIGEGHGNPLQCSCLENPRDGGAWWASVYGVAQSRTQLKRLSSSISVWTRAYVFYNLYYNLVMLFTLFKLFQSGPLGALSG